MNRILLHLLRWSREVSTLEVVFLGAMAVGLLQTLWEVATGTTLTRQLFPNPVLLAMLAGAIWYLYVPVLSARILSKVQYQLVQRSWRAIVVGGSRAADGIGDPLVPVGTSVPGLRTQARDLYELSAMLEEAKSHFGVLVQLQREQGCGLTADGTLRTTPFLAGGAVLGMAKQYRREYRHLGAELRSTRAEIRRLAADPAPGRAGQLLLKAERKRARALRAQMDYVANLFNPDKEARATEAEWKARLAEWEAQEAAARGRHAAWKQGKENQLGALYLPRMPHVRKPASKN